LETQGTELIAASRRNTEELQKFSKRFNTSGYTDYKELLRDPDVAAVVIATPHQEHARIVLDAAQSGKHILLEKPMATSIADCDRIIASAETYGITLMIGHSMQFMRSSEIAKKLLDSGELGEIIYGTGTVAKKWITQNRRDWHRDDPAGGGMLMTMGIHYIDLLTWLYNSRVSSVRANLSTSFHKQQADDSAMIFLQYENGLTGTVISTGYDSGAETFIAELTCTKGMLRMDMRGGVYMGKNDRWMHLPGSESENTNHEALLNEWDAFIRAVETNSVPQVTGAYGKHIMEICFAARESSLNKKEIWI
ncbi:MAG: Gfo/Idh/MocA family oxidoreductase, partial [Bacteroidales bacterium]|nr:Gfo/Idh/MocA family oxidoreductase [Bacteroidales bacterium]